MFSELWVFDVDDTIIFTYRDYEKARKDASLCIKNSLGEDAPTEQEILALEDQIDREKIKEINPDTGTPYYYCRDRFPRSLSDTYRAICGRLGRMPTPFIVSYLKQIGNRVFDKHCYAKNIKPGVRELLHHLVSMGHQVVLLTKGDAGVQSDKVTALMGAGLPFHEAIIVEHDKQHELERLIAEHRRQSGGAAFSVGDNYESDIKPALALGYQGVWVKVFNWETHHKKSELELHAEAHGCRIVSGLEDFLPLP